MINFNISKDGGYAVLTIDTAESRCMTVILDEVEAVQVAIQLITAAGELLPEECQHQGVALVAVLADLEGEWE